MSQDRTIITADSGTAFPDVDKTAPHVVLLNTRISGVPQIMRSAHLKILERISSGDRVAPDIAKACAQLEELFEEAHRLIKNSNANPDDYQATADNFEKAIAEARVILEKAQSCSHPCSESLAAIMKKVEEMKLLFEEHRDKQKGFLATSAGEQMLRLCKPARLYSLPEATATLEMVKYLRVKISLSPIHSARIADAVDKLHDEIQEERTIADSTVNLGNEIAKMEKRIDSVTRPEKLKAIHKYQMPYIQSLLDSLASKNRSATRAPRQVVFRDSATIDSIVSKFEECRQKLHDIFNAEVESDSRVHAITEQLREMTDETPIDFWPMRKLDVLETQLREVDSLAAWLQLEEIRKLRKKYEESKQLKSRFLAEFMVDKVIGAGSFGCVFRARHHIDKRDYAVKRISLKQSVELNNKTFDEVLRMSRLYHPGIVRYHNAWIERSSEYDKLLSGEGSEPLNQCDSEGSTLGRHCSQIIRENCIHIFIQMELCQESLSSWLKRHMTRRDHKQMVSWFAQIIAALEYIHGEQMFHRDLKPMNILVVSEAIVKICDLGIAADCFTENESMMLRTDVGTPLYKAPEQNYYYDKRVDIFSSGLILLEMCAVMTEMEKIQAFYDVRCGKSPVILEDQPVTQDLVSKLTRLDKADRPSFDEIRAHPFFVPSSISKIL